MLASIYADSFYISTYILGLAWVVMSLSVVLVNKRRRNLPFYYTPVVGWRPGNPDDPETLLGAESYMESFRPVAERETLTVAPDLMPDIPAEWKLQPQKAEPDQIVIHIEPDGAPTSQQRNIQRIIDHLKSTSESTAQAAS
jgi:hypothetical protein